MNKTIKEFREKFPKINYNLDSSYYPDNQDNKKIETFILQRLAEQKKEIEKEGLMAISKRAGQEFYEEWKNDLVEKIEGMKNTYEVRTGSLEHKNECDNLNLIHNEAIDQILTILK